MRGLAVSIVIMSLIIMIGACKKEEPKMPQVENAQGSSPDDFSDLKAPTGGCKTEEDLKKKLEEEAQAKKPSKLQGGNTDCKVN